MESEEWLIIYDFFAYSANLLRSLRRFLDAENAKKRRVRKEEVIDLLM